MTDWVRVKHAATGHHYTVPRAKAESDAALKILEGVPAVDLNGRPLPAKPHRPLSEVAPAKTAPKEAAK